MQEGLFCYTPDGADYVTWPYCGKDDHFNTYVNNPKNYDEKYYDKTNNEKHTKYDFLFEDEYENDMRRTHNHNFCANCKILFQIGCMHAEFGCTDGVYNGHLIKRWRDKNTNIEYNGMPIFDSVDDWFNHANDVEVIEIFCSSDGARCNRGYKIPEKYVKGCIFSGKN